MELREQIMDALHSLATQRPADRINYADVAKVSGVHWTIVRRYLGNKQEMRRIITEMTEGEVLVETRTRILDAASLVFVRFGYDGTTIEQIALEANMNSVALYGYYSSKSELFLEIYERCLSQLLREIVEQYQQIIASAHPVQALASWLQAQLQSRKQGQVTLMLIFEITSISRERALLEKIFNLHRKIHDETGSMLKEMQQQGILKNDMDPYLLAINFHSQLNSLQLIRYIDPAHPYFDSLIYNTASVIWKIVK